MTNFKENLAAMFAYPLFAGWAAICVKAIYLLFANEPLDFEATAIRWVGQSLEAKAIRFLGAYFLLLLGLRGVAVLARSHMFEAAILMHATMNLIGAAIVYLLFWFTTGRLWESHAVLLGFIGLSIAVLFPMMRHGLMSGHGRTRTRVNAPEQPRVADVARVRIPKITFKDIYGNAAIKSRLKEAALAVIATNTTATAKRNGILLHGGPGNGKTVFAEALAGELNLPLLQLSYSDVASQWVGEKTTKIRQAFEQAMRSQPCLLFIDEFESFLESRSGDRNDGTKEDRDAVNALLTLMVDLREHRVILMAATNHIDRLDSAGIREGRFDFKVEITPPDAEARQGLLRAGIQKNLPGAVVPESVIDAVSRRWNGFSVKRILAVTEELPSHLRRVGKAAPDFQDFLDALRTLQGQRGAVPENVKSLEELVLSGSTRDMLDQIVARMEDPEHTERHGGTLPSGVLFFGPPGTGKTATCKALAKSVGWAFLPATGADLARNPRDLDKLYEKAKELRPTIIFIDEADELLRAREYSNSTEATNKLLTLMDGVGDRVTDIVWIAATNHPESIDQALLRGGRFTEKVLFETPSAEQLEAYLAQWLSKRSVRLEDGLSAAAIAAAVEGQSIANAEAVVQGALNRAVGRRGQEVVLRSKDVEQAKSAVLT